MRVGDLVTNNYGSIFLIIGRSKGKKPWGRKLYIYSARFGIMEISWKHAVETMSKVND